MSVTKKDLEIQANRVLRYYQLQKSKPSNPDRLFNFLNSIHSFMDRYFRYKNNNNQFQLASRDYFFTIKSIRNIFHHKKDINNILIDYQIDLNDLNKVSYILHKDDFDYIVENETRFIREKDISIERFKQNTIETNNYIIYNKSLKFVMMDILAIIEEESLSIPKQEKEFYNDNDIYNCIFENKDAEDMFDILIKNNTI